MSSEFIDINLLPPPVRSTRSGGIWLRRMLPSLILLAVATCLVLGSSFLKIRNDRLLESQRQEMSQAQQGVVNLSTIVTELEILQKQVSTLAAQAEQLEADAERVTQENPALTPFMRAVTENLLPRMSLTGFVAEGERQFIVQGEAGSASLVISYVEALKQQPSISTVTVRAVEKLGGQAPPSAVRWTLVIEW